MDSSQNECPTHKITLSRNDSEYLHVLSNQQMHAHCEHTFKEEPTLGKEMQAQNADVKIQQQRASKGAGRQNKCSHLALHCQKDLSLSQQQRGGEVANQSDEQRALLSVPPSLSQLVGKRRRKKYPEISLVCVVCGKKLSSRMSVLNHMTTQHPSVELPEALAPLAARSTAKAQSHTRRGQKKKLTKSDVRVSTSDSILAGESDTGAGQDERAGRQKSQPASKRGRGKKLMQSGTQVGTLSDLVQAEELCVSEVSQKDSASNVERLKRNAELESLVCETCGMTFEHKQQMNRHRRLCTWKVCHLCSKAVKRLDMHLKRHSSPGQFSCPRCTKTFRDRHHLNQHMLYHNGERPFCCEVCGMRYHERTVLNAHLRTHAGIKPFKCTQCDAAFTRMRGLSDHMRVHTGEKPYRCQVCGRQFSSSGNLAAHRRKVHRMEPLKPNHRMRKLYIEPSTSSIAAAADESMSFHPSDKNITII